MIDAFISRVDATSATVAYAIHHPDIKDIFPVSSIFRGILKTYCIRDVNVGDTIHFFSLHKNIITFFFVMQKLNNIFQQLYIFKAPF